MVKYLIQNKDYVQLHSLLQYHVLSDQPDLARVLVLLGSTDEGMACSMHYLPAFQLGVDMMLRLKANEEIVAALISEGSALKALDFAVDAGVHSLKKSTILQCVERLNDKQQTIRASNILKRIAEIQKFDELKLKADKNYRPIFIEEEKR